MLLFYCAYDLSFIFFFNDTATTEIYTLSLHDALPICSWPRGAPCSTRTDRPSSGPSRRRRRRRAGTDRKSTRLNSSHGYISYAVFCLKKKNDNYQVWTVITNIKYWLDYLKSFLPF